MINRLTQQVVQQASAFGLAAIVTLLMFSGIDSLARVKAAGETMSQTSPAQAVVIVGQHGSRS